VNPSRWFFHLGGFDILSKEKEEEEEERERERESTCGESREAS